MNTCYIFGALGAGIKDFKRDESDIVIAADEGYRQLLRLGIEPDLTVGDFDSLGYAPAKGEVIRHPVMKNDTDMMLAVKTGLERGFSRLVIYGGIGGRLDHTIANIQTLGYISSHGAKGFLVDGEQVITAVTDGKIQLCGGLRGIISVFSLGVAEGVNLRGLKYPLCDYEMTADFPIGVSNEFTGAQAEISVKGGTLIVMWHGTPSNII